MHVEGISLLFFPSSLLDSVTLHLLPRSEEEEGNGKRGREEKRAQEGVGVTTTAANLHKMCEP